MIQQFLLALPPPCCGCAQLVEVSILHIRWHFHCV